jgi:hypothetical protein
MRATGERSVARRDRLVRSLRELGAAPAHIPGDELAQHGRAVPLTGQAAELFPQVVFDPDGSVRRVGVLHGVIVTRGYAPTGQAGLPCISTGGTVADVRVYIHVDNDSTAQTEVSGAVSERNRTLPAHANCSHKRYWLTCEQYEELIEACGNCCQTCQRPAAECRPHSKLYIDHDQHYGIWAVRGLLCPRCNSLLISDRPDPAWAQDYIANPWFRRAFAEMGVSIEMAPEPPLKSHFRSPKGTSWVREEDGWRCWSYSLCSRTWRDMCMNFSPLHLRHVNIPTSANYTETDNY